MGRGGAKLRDSRSPRNSKSRGAPARRQERLGVRGARTRSGSRSPGGSRSPASRLESMIGGLSDESELSSSSDEEALRRQRARALQASESRRGSPTPGDVRQQQVRRYLPRYSDSDSDSDSDVSAARSPRPRRSMRGSAVRLDLTGIERALDHDHWPTPGAATPGCLHCRFVWDPDGEFERHKVEGTVRDLMEGKAMFGGKKHERLSERQGEELLRELRYIAHMQRRGALAVRRAHLLDATSFATGTVLPLLLAISFHYGLLAISSVETGLECSDGGDHDGCAVSGEGSFYLLSLLCLLLSVISVGTHIYEKLSSIRTRGEREIAVGTSPLLNPHSRHTAVTHSGSASAATSSA
jgi:hypothetical protein|eukprot:COSAG06_NODE_860_length_11903_cov_3.097170_2_plen_354_part_00